MRLEDGRDPVPHHQPPRQPGPAAVQVHDVGLDLLDDPVQPDHRAGQGALVGIRTPPSDRCAGLAGGVPQVALRRAGHRDVPAALDLVTHVAGGHRAHAPGRRHGHVQDVQPPVGLDLLVLGGHYATFRSECFATSTTPSNRAPDRTDPVRVLRAARWRTPNPRPGRARSSCPRPSPASRRRRRAGARSRRRCRTRSPRTPSRQRTAARSARGSTRRRTARRAAPRAGPPDPGSSRSRDRHRAARRRGPACRVRPRLACRTGRPSARRPAAPGWPVPASASATLAPIQTFTSPLVMPATTTRGDPGVGLRLEGEPEMAEQVRLGRSRG